MQTSVSLSDLAAAGKQVGAADGTLSAVLNRIMLPEPEIEVWLARLDLDADQAGYCASLLSRDERLRADRFHFERGRRRFTVARGILRILLGTHLKMQPAAIAFGYSKNGKPFVAGRATQIHFNVSHAEERALYAISKRCAVGVDIEYLNRDIDCGRLAERFFTPGERAALQLIPEIDRKQAFFACWTRKEAVVKATGDGLSLPLDQFEVTIAPGAAPRVVSFVAAMPHAADWTLYAVDSGSDYIATVAAYRPSDEN